MKECPHCHEDSFGWRELIFLDYFSPSECKACGKPVRNDGVRQFLTVPTILGALFLGLVVFSVLPGAFEAVGFLFIFVLIGLSLLLLAKPSRFEEPNAGFPSFTPDLDNDKAITVSGWNENELRRIVDDFRQQGTIDPPMEIEIQQPRENQFVLTFPGDIAPGDFAALVNYLNYPFDFDLANRVILVAGRTTLNSDFSGIPESLIGRKAILYVPANDEDYSVVYMRTETGDNFAVSMNEIVWQSVDEPRLLSDFDRLTNID
jgi:hypothetical protein